MQNHHTLRIDTLLQTQNYQPRKKSSTFNLKDKTIPPKYSVYIYLIHSSELFARVDYFYYNVDPEFWGNHYLKKKKKKEEKKSETKLTAIIEKQNQNM